MILYLAGPMTGIKDHNFPAFHEAARRLRYFGHTVINPAENLDGDTSKSWAFYMKMDLGFILQSDGVAVLPGWSNSRGARLEVLVAKALELPIFDAITMLLQEETMPLNTFEQAVEQVANELQELMIRKQRDYGHKNIMEFGEYGCLVRANDKMARLKNLLESGKAPQNESLEDSWKDLANYSIIALMVRRGIFTLPLAPIKTAEEIAEEIRVGVLPDED